jgi:flagellar basal-body rod modification protein FlgD
MASSSAGSTGSLGSTSGVSPGSTAQGPQLTSKNKNEQLGKNEFLTLLVTQLKNQDPEAPLDSKEFAVQLAQFTSVEKLISIEQKLTAQSDAATLGSLAGYLGHRVVLNNTTVDVKGGNGGQLQATLARDASGVQVQFLNSSGKVVGQKDLGPLSAGKQVISLDGVTVPDGTYSFKVVAANRFGGGTFEPTSSPVGLVSGFIPGPTPKLIVNGGEISMSDVKEVALNNLSA